MKSINNIITLIFLLLFINCAGKIGLSRSNISDMPEWYKNYREYKYYDPDSRIYGKGFAEELFLNQAMDNASSKAISNLAQQIGTYCKRTDILESVSNNSKRVNSGERKKRNNKNTSSREASNYSNQLIENISDEVLRRPIEEITDTWEKEKDGVTIYRSWTIWSVSVNSVEQSLLERMNEDPEFYDAIEKLYLK